jgi:subtilisin family serine protease
VTYAARPLRGALPVLAALTVASTCALPALAAGRAGTPGTTSVTRGGLWWLTELSVPAAWRAAPGTGTGVTVAVLSTGVDAAHPDLTGTVMTGPDFADTGRKQGDPYWGYEGTAVAALIAGHGHGAGGLDGVTGVAPGARILSVQVTLEYDDPLNSDAAVTRRLPDAIAEGIRYAVGRGATVIALPLDPGTLGSAPDGDPAAAGGSAAERAAVSYALAHNVLLVAPAGDNGASTGTANYPAAYPGVIAVGATGWNGKLAPFTSTQPYVALTAPGSGQTPRVPQPFGESTDPTAGLTVPTPGGGYESLASTDMAAALTAGVAALIRARYPRLTVAEVTQALESSAIAPPGKAGWGHGSLNAGTALTAAATIARIAAAHPAPTPRATPTAPASPASTATRSAAKHGAAPATGAAAMVRSLLVGVVVGACALIAILIVALSVARFRRRAREGRRKGPSHARHSRGQPLPPRPALPPSRPALQLDSPGGNPQPGTAPGGSPWLSPAPASSFVPRSGTAHRSLNAARSADAPLAPWERSPADFAMSPLPQDAPWPASTTGPMYVWNPSATGPQPVLDEDDRA